MEFKMEIKKVINGKEYVEMFHDTNFETAEETAPNKLYNIYENLAGRILAASNSSFMMDDNGNIIGQLYEWESGKLRKINPSQIIL